MNWRITCRMQEVNLPAKEMDLCSLRHCGAHNLLSDGPLSTETLWGSQLAVRWYTSWHDYWFDAKLSQAVYGWIFFFRPHKRITFNYIDFAGWEITLFLEVTLLVPDWVELMPDAWPVGYEGIIKLLGHVGRRNGGWHVRYRRSICQPRSSPDC